MPATHIATGRNNPLVPPKFPSQNSMQFSGGSATDNVDVGHGSTLQNLTAFSVCHWVYARSSGGGGGERLWQHGNPLAYGGTNNLSFVATFSTTSGTWFTNNNVFPFGRWMHVCITYDGSSTSNTPTLYLNGRTSPFTQTVAPVGTYTTLNSSDWIFGNNANTGGVRCFDGWQQDMRIYSRLLTQAEVSAIYQTGDISITNCVVLLLGNDGGGSSMADSSGNSNTGVITGATFSQFTHR